MTQFEVFKKNIAECTSPMEMAGLIEGLRVAAALYCEVEFPDEVIIEHGTIELPVYGMTHYLESVKK